jgi:Polyketide cyclase / dehydrase and lipid transport
MGRQILVRNILLLLLAAIVVLLVYASTRPDTFTVQRSISIDAPANVVYPLIADFHNWSTWSPFEKMDPAMKRTLSGADSGRGAVYAWEGNDQAGVGRMEITAASPPSNVAIQLDFTKPFAAHNNVDFTLAPKNNATTVTWTMRGTNGYVGKLMGVFFNMDDMVGGQFDSGLAAMKAEAERRAKAAPPPQPPAEMSDVPPSDDEKFVPAPTEDE